MSTDWPGCGKAAEFAVYGGSEHPEDYTDACEAHVGVMLGTPMFVEGDNVRWTVEVITAPTDRYCCFIPTEGSAEVPAEARADELERMCAHWERFPRHITNRFEVFASAYGIGASDERTRLEARLAEVEAERDMVQRNFDRVAEVVSCGGALDEMEERAKTAGARLTALRAAVRPLVEALGPLVTLFTEGVPRAHRLLGYAPDERISLPYFTFEQCEEMRAALADPAIAALLEGGEK